MPGKWILQIEAEGASEADKLRAIAAAQAFFETAGVTPYQAALSAFRQEGEIEDFTDAEGHHAELWRQAQDVATAACCEGSGQLPVQFELNLVQV